MLKRTSKLKLSGAYALSVAQSAVGGILLFVFGISLIVALYLLGQADALIAVSAVFDIIAVILLRKGSRNRRALKAANKLEPMLMAERRIKVGLAAAKIGYSDAKTRSYMKLAKKKGYIDNIYITRDENEIVYCEGVFIEDEPEKPKPVPEKTEGGEERPHEEHIRELEALDWRITNEKMAGNVREILTISREIFDYADKNPEKMNQLRRFRNYYLPTVLKLLRNYEDMSRQAHKGDNIKESMSGIEGIMDGVVDTFRREHDNLYKDAALDISSDIEVLRMMMDSGLGDGKFGKM